MKIKTISIVIPVFNESKILSILNGRLINTLTKSLKTLRHEIIYVDDGSTDGTFSQIEKLYRESHIIQAIQFSRNFGHHVAITAGLEISRGDFVVIMDGDLQDQPEEIPNLFQKISNGYDIVRAERVGIQFGTLKRLFSGVFNWFVKRITNDAVDTRSGIFRIMTRQVVDNVLRLHEHDRYLTGMISWTGFLQTSIPVKHGARLSGKTKYNFARQLKLALSAIYSFSEFPQKIVVLALVMSILLPLLILGYILSYKAYSQNLVLIMFTIILLQESVFAVIATMFLSRIYIESRNRPLYIVKKHLAINKK